MTRYLPFVLELRKRLLFAVSLFVVASLIGFIYYERIITFVLSFFSLKGVNIVFTTPFQFFTLALNCGLIVGVIVVIPILIYQFLSFLKPALRPKEYRLLVTILPLAILLFIGGFIYGVAMMKYVVQIFYQTSVKLQIGNILDVESFLSKVLITGLLMAVAFLFPIAMTILMQLKLVKHKTFNNQRPIAYLIGLAFVILLPPPDLMSDVILFAPLVILFELTLLLNRIFLKTHLM
ncbi:MAG: twin-arginine translocase subunit TatC [bacterium]|nr:twin-arginine translocase subunit TatC [bacterium]